MQVESILSDNIQKQLLDLNYSIDPLEDYINNLLVDVYVKPNIVATYINKRTVLACQEIDRVNSDVTLTNTLQLMHLNQSIDKQTALYQSLLNQINCYFLMDLNPNE